MRRTIWMAVVVLTGGLMLTACGTNMPEPSATLPQTPTAQTQPYTPTAMPTDVQTDDPTPGLTATAPTTSTPLPTATRVQPTATAVAAAAAPAANYGPAPEIDTDVWLNTDQPLRLAELRGKVALIEFWTYG